MSTASDEIGDGLRAIVGLAEGAEPTLEQAEKIRKLGRISIALVELACDQGKADDLTPEEVLAAYRFGLSSLSQAVRVLSAAKALVELEGDG